MTKLELDNKQREMELAAEIVRAANNVVRALEKAAAAIDRLNELKEQLEQG